MEDKIGIKAKGYVKVTNELGKVVWEDHNAIGPDILTIVTRCLTQVDFDKQVDTIRAIGNFGQVDRTIHWVNYEPSTNTITFRATFYEFDFDGNITELELLSTSLAGLQLAHRDTLNIDKDGSSRLQVDWSITITNC